MKKYIDIHIKINEEYYDLAYGVLFDHQFNGIEEKIDELVITSELDSWRQEIEDRIISDLNELDPNSKIIDKKVYEDKNWLEDFEKNTPIIKINENISITPSWKSNDVDCKYKIIIDPKMSFGTGEHSTTKLMCQLLEKYVEPGSNWIDAGCGTGVLAILASKLGASEIDAFDFDEWCVLNSKENIQLNSIENIKLQQSKIEDFNFYNVDGIVANIFSNLLINSMAKFDKALELSKGTLLLSGILKYDKKEVIDKAISCNFKLTDEIFDEEWVGLGFKHL